MVNFNFISQILANPKKNHYFCPQIAIVRKRHYKFIYMAEYINPRVDWAFKRIFGSDDTKESSSM